MNYQKIYDQLMDRANGRVLYGYFETHHILSRSLDGGDEVNNLVDLTYREHFLAHWLLVKIYKEGRSHRAMLYAFRMMGIIGIGDRIIAGWQYEMARRVCSDGLFDLQLSQSDYMKRRQLLLYPIIRIRKRGVRGKKHPKPFQPWKEQPWF
jgi:hypothetical protein